MPYLPRHLGSRLAAYLRQFPCVLVLGARQVGKSTFLRHQLGPDWQGVDLEDPPIASLVADAPDLFLRDRPRRVWFDEAQRVPALFDALRVNIDADRSPGRYVLSGSTSPALLRGISESLAGRVGVLELGPLCAAERHGLPPPGFLHRLRQIRGAGDLVEAFRQPPPDIDVPTSWLGGGYPEPSLMADPVARWRWFDSYVRTVSERDLVPLGRDLPPPALDRLLRMLAARHGQPVNVTSLARDFGVAARTISRYLDALEGAFLWRRTAPWLVNVGKRLVKSPRGALVDSGLLHHLLQLHDLDALQAHPTLGSSWEGWVAGQIHLQATLVEPAPALYTWRTQAGAEVDLVLDYGPAGLVPIEIKHATRVPDLQLRGLRAFLADFRDRAPFGLVVYRGQHVARREEDVVLLPAPCLFAAD